MQFTPQQMGGYKGYSTGVLIGNWNEDLQVQEDKIRKYQHLAQQKGSAAQMSVRVALTPAHDDGFLRFGDVVMLRSVASSCFLSLDTAPKSRPKLNHALVSASTSSVAAARNVWVIRRAADAHTNFYASQNEGDIVHYGQCLRIVNESMTDAGDYSLASCPLAASAQSRVSGRQEVTACLGGTTDAVMFFEQSDGKQAIAPLDGQPIPVSATVVIRHKGTRAPLFCDKATRMGTSCGTECEVSAHLAKCQATRFNVPVLPENFWTFRVGPAGATPRGATNPNKDRLLLQQVRANILRRGGAVGFRGLAKALGVVGDDDESHGKTLSRRGLKEGLELYGVPVTTHELDVIFREFDRNGDGAVCVAEFLHAIRGDMNLRRTDLVRDVFRTLDVDGCGYLTMEELRRAFVGGLAEHPQVRGGQRTAEQMLREFNSCWDKDVNAKISMREFEEYYADLSASLPDDDAFERLVRVTWRLSDADTSPTEQLERGDNKS